MTPDAEISAAFWKHPRSDRAVMPGLEASAPTTMRPMTAHLDAEADQRPIRFFTSTGSAIEQGLKPQDLAIFSFVPKGFDVFATVLGHMTWTTDRATVDRLWNTWVVAWYEGGKDDPKLALQLFDPASAEIWRDGSSLLSGLKLFCLAVIRKPVPKTTWPRFPCPDRGGPGLETIKSRGTLITSQEGNIQWIA